MKFNVNKKIKISTAIALTISFMVTFSTVGIAVYALSFVQDILASLPPDKAYFQQFTLLNESLQIMVISFLIFALICAYYVTRLIMSPLIKLVDGSKELTKGNFQYRFPPSKYEEIDRLVGTYNQMAESLQNIYSELEAKVQERTLELQNANEELKSAQAMMVHSEKMRSLGQLVAGITHEINNPINFIHGNMPHLKNYSSALLELIELYEKFEPQMTDEQISSIKSLKEKIELDFIKEDLPLLIKSCHDGTERTKNIIIDLKNFSRLDERVINNVDLPKEIETTLNILHNKIKNKITIVKEYEDIPLVEGYGGQLNQVFMNILDNACYAIKDEGTIFIRLKKFENDVIIEFEDTGCGIEQAELDKIFDPFFTTKPVGEGTGLGMAISYKVIQEHKGKIVVESVLGKGTKFTITLPLKIAR